MNPEWNTETKILYFVGTILLVGVVSAVVLHYLMPTDPAHPINTNKWLQFAISTSVIVALGSLFDGSRGRNLVRQIPLLFVWSYVMFYLWPDGPGWREALAMIAVGFAVVGFLQWRRGRKQQSA